MYDPRPARGRRSATCCVIPEPVDTRHITVPKVSVAERLAHLRALLARGTFSFDEAVANADRVTIAVTLFALLELYKQGEATWTQDEPFGEITIRAGALAAGAGDSVSVTVTTSRARADARGTAVPVGRARSARTRSPTRPARELHEVVTGAREAARALRLRAARARAAPARRRLGAVHPPRRRAGRAPAAGAAADTAADAGAGGDARDRRLPAAGLAARDRPDPRRQRRVGGGDAARARDDRGSPAARSSAPCSTARPSCSCGCSG